MASPTFIRTLMSFARSSTSTSVSQKAFHRKTDSNTSESPIVLGSNWERSRQDIFTLQKRGFRGKLNQLPECGSMVEVGVLLRVLHLLVQPWLLKYGGMDGFVER